MKCKLDFITNSSSVNYVGWGIIISRTELENKLRKTSNGDNESDEILDPYEISENISRNSELLSCTMFDISYCIIAHPTLIKDDETLLEFKRRIVTELNNNGIGATTNSIKWIDIEV